MSGWRDEYGGPAFIDMPRIGFDDLDDHTVCHRFDGDASRAACGVPRSEQPEHGASVPAYVARSQSHCPWCGNPICGRCQEAIR